MKVKKDYKDHKVKSLLHFESCQDARKTILYTFACSREKKVAERKIVRQNCNNY